MKKRKTIEAILTKDTDKLGKQGTIVKVKPGYIRNYLIPLKFGKLATPSLVNQFNQKQEELEFKQQKFIEKCLENKRVLENLGTLTLKKRVSENGIFFGKITKNQLLDLIQDNIKLSIELDKNQLEVPTMKELGSYVIEIVLSTNITAKVNIEVLSE